MEADEDGPVLARALAAACGRQLLMAIEAELCALVEAAQGRRRAPGGETVAAEARDGPPARRLAVVLAEGLGGYGRLLVHKTVERFQGLRSFSIGVGQERRTLVLTDAPESVSCPFLRFDDFPMDASARITSRSNAPTEENSRKETVRVSSSTRSAASPTIYVPPSRRGDQGSGSAASAAKRDRPSTGVYVPPSRRQRAEDSTEQAMGEGRSSSETSTTVASEAASEDGTESSGKRRRGRGFQQRARRPFDEDFTLPEDEEPEHPADNMLKRDMTEDRSASAVMDEELTEILYMNDAELKQLHNPTLFAEWQTQYRPASTTSGVPDHWASLDQSRKRRLYKEKQKDRTVGTIGVSPYPEHVLELFDMTLPLTDEELRSILNGAESGDGSIRLCRINASTSLVAFPSKAQAQRVLQRHTADDARFKLRTFAEASNDALTTRGVALDVKEVPTRPPADSRVARRMLNHALGLSPKRPSDD